MRKYRIICALLALAMILSFGACNRPEGDERDKASNTPTETATETSVSPSFETPYAASETVPIPSDPPEGRSDLVILNWDAYVNRPHEIQPGTVLNYDAPNDVPYQLPWNCGAAGWLLDNVFEGLLYMYMNDPEDIRGCIAESWTHSDDYLTWTFKIRDGVTFTDRTVCDAYAVAKAWDYIIKECPASFSSRNIGSWEASNERVFVVHLSAPCAWFEAALSSSLLIVSPSALDLYGTIDNRAAVGTGPYYIASYKEITSLVLKANPDYYLEERMPCIETVNFRVYLDLNNVVNALMTCQIDGAGFSDFIGYHDLLRRGFDGALVSGLGSPESIWLNAKVVELFQIREIREAVCRFVDYDAINESLYDGLGRVQDSIWARGTSAYVPTDQFYYDPEEGQALLASVGLAASDIQFKINYYDSNLKQSDNVLYHIHEHLTQAGMNITLERFGPESSLTFWPNEGSISLYGIAGYSNAAPYLPWQYILKPDTLMKLCWQDLYDPALYEKMLSEYNAMVNETTWEGMLAHCKQLTAYAQDDFNVIGGVQAPNFVALSKDFKNGIYFSENLWLQLYYLYE